jgi:catechol 1,2-dioxygenase
MDAGFATHVTRGARALLVYCLPTADTTVGPFYRQGAPWRTTLCPVDEPGEPMSINGRITVLPDCSSIAGATLDIWQTNARGMYSNLLGLGDPADPRTFNLRGRLRSDDAGQYEFQSIVPGRYPLFWPLTRPRHVHMIVTHPQFAQLTTQIYFEGDEYNPWDPWWNASLTIRLEREVDQQSGRVRQRGVFDIVLRLRGN